MLADLASVGCDLVTVGQYLRALAGPPAGRALLRARRVPGARRDGPGARAGARGGRPAGALVVRGRQGGGGGVRPPDTNPQVLAIRADTTSGEGISHQEDLAARRPGDRDRLLLRSPEDAADAAAAVVRRALAETEDAEVAGGARDPAAAARLPLLLERPRLPGRMGGVLGLGLGGAPLPELRVAPGRAVRRRGPRRLRRGPQRRHRDAADRPSRHDARQHGGRGRAADRRDQARPDRAYGLLAGKGWSTLPPRAKRLLVTGLTACASQRSLLCGRYADPRVQRSRMKGAPSSLPRRSPASGGCGANFRVAVQRRGQGGHAPRSLQCVQRVHQR